MELEIHERLVRVETRLDGIERGQNEMAADLRIVRDHVIGMKAVSASRAKWWAKTLGIAGIMAGVWEKFGNHFRLG